MLTEADMAQWADMFKRTFAANGGIEEGLAWRPNDDEDTPTPESLTPQGLLSPSVSVPEWQRPGAPRGYPKPTTTGVPAAERARRIEKFEYERHQPGFRYLTKKDDESVTKSIEDELSHRSGVQHDTTPTPGPGSPNPPQRGRRPSRASSISSQRSAVFTPNPGSPTPAKNNFTPPSEPGSPDKSSPRPREQNHDSFWSPYHQHDIPESSANVGSSAKKRKLEPTAYEPQKRKCALGDITTEELSIKTENKILGNLAKEIGHEVRRRRNVWARMLKTRKLGPRALKEVTECVAKFKGDILPNLVRLDDLIEEDARECQKDCEIPPTVMDEQLGPNATEESSAASEDRILDQLAKDIGYEVRRRRSVWARMLKNRKLGPRAKEWCADFVKSFEGDFSPGGDNLGMLNEQDAAEGLIPTGTPPPIAEEHLVSKDTLMKDVQMPPEIPRPFMDEEQGSKDGLMDVGQKPAGMPPPVVDEHVESKDVLMKEVIAELQEIRSRARKLETKLIKGLSGGATEAKTNTSIIAGAVHGTPKRQVNLTETTRIPNTLAREGQGQSLVLPKTPDADQMDCTSNVVVLKHCVPGYAKAKGITRSALAYPESSEFAGQNISHLIAPQAHKPTKPSRSTISKQKGKVQKPSHNPSRRSTRRKIDSAAQTLGSRPDLPVALSTSRSEKKITLTQPIVEVSVNVKMHIIEPEIKKSRKRKYEAEVEDIPPKGTRATAKRFRTSI